MNSRKIASWCLFPLTMWYAVGIMIRNLMFLVGVKKTTIPPVTTIGVGNLCAGGAGKTPMVEYLLRMFGEQYETALLSRGYKRKTKGFVLAEEGSTAREIGDEPEMIHRKFPHVTTAVCEKRVVGINQLLKLPKAPQLIVMDDVYQHRQVKPTLNILLTEYDRPYFKDRILPFGNLREFQGARDRANVIIVTKSPRKINPLEKHAIINNLRAKPYQKVFFSSLKYNNPVELRDATVELSVLPKEILVVTGIAHPEPFVEELERYSKVKHLRFADHHDFVEDDLKEMQRGLAELGEGAIVITTEKDASRLRAMDTMGLPIYYISIEFEIQQSDDNNLDRQLQAIIKENIEYRERLQTTSLCKIGSLSRY